LFPVVLLLCIAGPAVAEKFDLSPYYGPPPIVGDFKEFELSTGGTRTVEVTAASHWKKGIRYVSRRAETGLEPSLAETFLIPGKRELLGDGFVTGLFIDLKKPMTLFKLKMKFGRANKIRGKGRAFYEGALVGPGEYSGAWTVEGLESLDTPTASYPDTAVLEVFLTLRVEDSLYGDVIGVITETVLWNARGLGEVASRRRTTVWLNGTLFEDSGWIEAWLVDGLLRGQPIP
jgi:hypothetical protein